jgi:hypothetical protein
MLVARHGEPVIVIPVQVGGEEVEWVFTSEAEADAALEDLAIQESLYLAGAWSDLDLDEMLDELDRMRHASPPSPPLDL